MLSALKTTAQRTALNSQRAFTVSSQRLFSTSMIHHQEVEEPEYEGKNTIQRKTLLLLQDSITKGKAKPTVDGGQRYHKMLRIGEVYHPQDLNDARYQEKLRQRRGQPVVPTEDPFDVLGLDPLHEYKNYRLLSHFVSDMGKILPREKTGLTAKNQRKLAKAVKRARAMGIMSSTSKATSSAYHGTY